MQINHEQNQLEATLNGHHEEEHLKINKGKLNALIA